jgi:hypothetical protein
MTEKTTEKDKKNNVIGSLYESTSKKNELYFKGKINDIKVLIFKNSQKSNDYDWNICNCPEKETGGEIVEEVGEEEENSKKSLNKGKQKLDYIGFLREKKSKKGNEYFEGTFLAEEIIVFKNSFKKENKHPDWIIYEKNSDNNENTEGK